MSNWPLLSGSNSLDDIGTSTATSSVTALTANATANVKGTTYTQLIAATANPYVGLFVWIQPNNTTAGRALIDIAVGASGSEVVLLPDIFFWSLSTTALRTDARYYFPIAVPAGVRLSMRAQSSVASWALRVGVMGVPVNPMFPTGFHRCTAYGVDTTDSGGTAIDSGATTHTKGTYAVLSSSTSNPIRVMTAVVAGSSTTTPGGGAAVLVDVAIGAASVEQPVIANLQYNRLNNTAFEHTHTIDAVVVNLPAATRLTARCQAGGTDAQARLQDVVVYGFD